MNETVILVGVIVLLSKELGMLVRRLVNGRSHDDVRTDHLAEAAVVARDVVEIKDNLKSTRKDIHDLRDAIAPLTSALGLHEWRLRALEKQREEGA